MKSLIDCRQNPKRIIGLGIIQSICVCAASCSGAASALDPAGQEARRIAQLFWGMLIGATLLWSIVMGLAFYASRQRATPVTLAKAHLFILWGGAIIPTLILTALLLIGLAPLPALVASAPDGSLRVLVSGEQWWWRVQYQPPNGAPVVLANEFRLPVGAPVEFRLSSPDVNHSFWIPSLAGKVDMIPGRETRLALTPTRTGTFRGICAEYCGDSHALMQFEVQVMEQAAFDQWLQAQAAHASAPANPLAVRGQAVFLAQGCNACHAIRGTNATGVLGPDLTHVGSRRHLAAATLPNNAESLRRWIAHPNEIKPEALMPAFNMLSADELQALAAYLEGLK